MSDSDDRPPFRKGGGKSFEKGRKFGPRPASRPASRPSWRDRDSGGDGPAILYGWHTVCAALANPGRNIRKLLLTENAARRLADENIDTRVTPEIVRPQLIDQRLGPDAVHQGMLAEADPLPSPDISTLEQEGIVLVLDQITDPQNAGAILRSAAAFGVSAVVVQDRHAPPESGALAKAASGALDIVPIATVVNISRALEELAELGFWRVASPSRPATRLRMPRRSCDGLWPKPGRPWWHWAPW
jgi:23S rRNA (guanosine2251-2'-O)-methyltransferase